MKSVLISIQPKWCELIASGKKTVEVRKTKPKLEVPFKCYIYCTKGNDGKYFWTEEVFEGKLGKYAIPYVGNGKVIGEFVCDSIEALTERDLFEGMDEISNSRIEEYSCLSIDELLQYKGSKSEIYGWHISDLVIYDKPRELSELKKPCICKGEYEGEEYCDCLNCDFAADSDYGIIACDRPITRPPQSWGYVESEDTE